jgi:hypothetical protein
MIFKPQHIFFLLTLGSWLLSPSFGHTADISVTLTLDRSEATHVDSVRMKVSVSGARESTSSPVILGLDAFHITQGGTSSRVEIINGKMNAGVDYTYFLQPKQTGTFQIGPAELTIKGKTYQSNTVTLTVFKSDQATGADQGPIFLVATLSSNNVYLEEQTIYVLKLYIQTNVRDISLHPLEVEGISFTQLGEAQEYQSVYNNQPYKVIEVRFALIPFGPGEYVIGPAKMNMTVVESRRRSPRSLFDDPFFNFTTGRPVTIASEPLTLNVRPLPERGRPADFIGLVGRFEMTSGLEPSTIKAGESATLTVQIKGLGKINLVPDLKIPPLKDTKIYSDQPVLNATQDRDGVGGSKTMKWAVVPEREGQRIIPPITLSYFDTNTHQYRILKTPSYSLTVIPGEGLSDTIIKGTLNNQGANGSTKQTIKELGRDILPVHTSIKALSQPLSPARIVPAIWLVLLSPFVIYGSIFFIFLFRKRSLEGLAEAAAKRAAKEFSKQCRQNDLCADHLLPAIRNYLNKRLGLSLGAITTNEAFQILESKGVGHETIHDICKIIQKCEDAVYTGQGQSPVVQDAEVVKLIKRIDKEIQ